MRNRIVFNISFVIVSLVVCLFFMPARFAAFDNYLNFILPIIGLINVIVFWSTSTKIMNSWIGYDTLFLLGFVIVHFQIPFLASIGVEPSKSDFVWINKQVVNYATWMSLMAMLVWMLGFWLSALKRIKEKPKTAPKLYKVDTKKIDIFLLILFVAFIGLVGSDFLSGKYDGGDNWGVGANYAFMLLRIVIVLKLIYFFINSKYSNKSNLINTILQEKMFILILVSFVFIFFAAGDRGPVLDVLITTGLLYSIFHKKISLGKFISFVVIGSFLMSVLSLGRSRDTVSDKGIFSQGYENFTQKDDTPIFTEELAMSNRILYRAIDVVPDTHPYLSGATFASEIAGVIPFGGSTFMELTGTPDLYRSSSYFFTILGQGQHFTFGEGSEILGDIYINFGFYGVLILMLALGYFISYIMFKYTFTRKHIFLICYVILVMGALYINRSHFLDPLKPLIYAIVIDRLFAKKIAVS